MLKHEEIVQKIESLPENDIQEVEDFIDFIIQKRKKNSPANNPTGSIFGQAKGLFSTSSDFNEPLDDFKEYM